MQLVQKTVHSARFMYWKEKQNQRKAFDEIAQQLGITKQSDWFSLSASQLQEYGVSGLLAHYYNNSLFASLQSIYPEFEWLPWQFKTVTRGCWTLKENQRKCLDSIAEELGIETQEDWYLVSIQQVKKLRDKHNYCLYSTLQEIYPEYEWSPWMFRVTPKGAWKDLSTQQKCLDWLAEKLQLKHKSDWFSVPLKNLRLVGGGRLLARYRGSFYNTLGSIYPEIGALKWISDGQQHTYNLLKSMLKTEVIMDHKMQYKEGAHMELDIYIPELMLAFEYQGGMHYDTAEFFYGSSKQRQARDNLKQKVCAEKGITLIRIPYWWNNSLATLASTIRSVRPDIAITLPDSALTVSEQHQL